MTGFTPASSNRLRDRLLALIAIVAAFAALKASYSVAMPALFALIIVMGAWPLDAFLKRWLPGWLATTLTILALIALLVGFGWALFLASSQMVGVLSERWPEIQQRYASIAAQLGIPSETLDNAAGPERLTGIAKAAAMSVYGIATYIGFIGILVIFGLPEVPRLRERLAAAFGKGARHELVGIATESSRQIRSYFGVTLFTSVLTGVGSVAIALATGLDLALVWGLLNFLLNFVPVIGNIIGIIPPALYAMLQFDGITMPVIVLVAFAALQLVISNVVYPLLQGRQLAISPVVIVLAMAFWSWLWGIAGALIAVPLTAAVIIVCEQSERTRWFAELLTRSSPPKTGEGK